MKVKFILLLCSFILRFCGLFFANRMYNINEPQVVVYTHNLSGTDCLAGSHQTSMGAHELGERAIAFHFGTSIEVKQTSDGISDVKWPVYILWANGDVYTLHTSLKYVLYIDK